MLSYFQLQCQCNQLQSRKNPSVLLQNKSMATLAELSEDFLNDLILEMAERYLLFLC